MYVLTGVKQVAFLLVVLYKTQLALVQVRLPLISFTTLEVLQILYACLVSFPPPPCPFHSVFLYLTTVTINCMKIVIT